MKLLNLLGILEIEREIRCQDECRELDDAERRRTRAKYLDDQKAETMGAYTPPFNLSEIGQLKNRAAIWFITGHGPFRYHLAKLDRSRVAVCRFCLRRLEDAGHLMRDCEEIEPFECSNVAEFEARCAETAKMLFI